MRWVRSLEGFHVLRFLDVGKKLTTALPNPIVVLASESSSLFTWDVCGGIAHGGRMSPSHMHKMAVQNFKYFVVRHSTSGLW